MRMFPFWQLFDIARWLWSVRGAVLFGAFIAWFLSGACYLACH